MAERVGLIARADNGGLGTQTWEAWRHLKPANTLVLQMDGAGRGTDDLARYKDRPMQVARNAPNDAELLHFLESVDVVFTCECYYRDDFVRLAADRGVRCVSQANPELYDPAALGGSTVVLPTPWEAQRVPHDRVLPVPIALDRFMPKQRTEAKVFYHPWGPAFHDRNGTLLVEAAIPYITEDVTIIVRGARQPLGRFQRPVQVTDHVTRIDLPFSDEPYWTAYPDADVLLLPRRYGGLCLPMQEAAALGMPTLTTALDPQRVYPHAWFVPAELPYDVSMRGGVFDVWNVNPILLAGAIDELVASPHIVKDLSEAAYSWSQRLGWEHWRSEYENVLCPT